MDLDFLNDIPAMFSDIPIINKLPIFNKNTSSNEYDDDLPQEDITNNSNSQVNQNYRTTEDDTSIQNDRTYQNIIDESTKNDTNQGRENGTNRVGTNKNKQNKTDDEKKQDAERKKQNALFNLDFENYKREVKKTKKTDFVDYRNLQYLDNYCKPKHENTFFIIGVVLIVFAIVLMLLFK